MKALTIQQWFKANSLFSLFFGVVMAVAPAQLSGWLGWPVPFTLLLLGLGLVLFAGLIFYLSRSEMITRAVGLAVIAADISWVLMSLLLVWLNPLGLTRVGLVSTFVIAVCVAVFAAGQLLALKRHCNLPSA